MYIRKMEHRTYYIAIKWLIQLILGISLVFTDEYISIEFGEVDSDNQMVPILYSSTSEITGFQFFIVGMDVTSVSGGIAEELGFMVSAGTTTVLGFSLSGDVISAGTGILTQVVIQVYALKLS